MPNKWIGRRGFLASAAAVLTVPAVARAQQVPMKPDRLIVNASGGEMGNAVLEAYGKVFLENTGIPIEMTSPHDLGKLRAMVESGNVEWDVTEISGDDGRIAVARGLLEPIDKSIVDLSDYPAEARDPYLLTTSVYSTVLAYRSDVFTDSKPRTWADFWNVKAFPGRRSLVGSPEDNIEFALIADGVPLAELYPLDVDRAFRKLDEIRPHITAWWDSGAQHVQMLVDKEVVMSSAWNGRIFNAASKGHPLEISWEGSSLHRAYFAIPRGAPNLYWSQHFLAAMTDPQAQAVFANQFVSPGLNPRSADYVDPALARYLPTIPENMRAAFWQDDLWWSEHLVEVKDRWQRWMLG